MVSLACGALGVLVVLRGLSFIGDALGHCVVPGVVIGYLLHTPIEVWGLGAALVSAGGIAALNRRARLRPDAAIAIVFTTSFALGLALISASRSYLTDLTQILFGNVLGVDAADLAISTVCALIVIGTLLVLYRPLVLVAFDATSAQAVGLPRAQLDLVLYALIAVAIVSGAVATGSLLVTALLVVPAAAARLLVRSVAGQMLTAAGIGCVSGWVGLYASYYWRIATGGSVVLAAVGMFVLAVMVGGVVHQRTR